MADQPRAARQRTGAPAGLADPVAGHCRALAIRAAGVALAAIDAAATCRTGTGAAGVDAAAIAGALLSAATEQAALARAEGRDALGGLPRVGVGVGAGVAAGVAAGAAGAARAGVSRVAARVRRPAVALDGRFPAAGDPAPDEPDQASAHCDGTEGGHAPSVYSAGVGRAREGGRGTAFCPPAGHRARVNAVSHAVPTSPVGSHPIRLPMISPARVASASACTSV